MLAKNDQERELLKTTDLSVSDPVLFLLMSNNK